MTLYGKERVAIVGFCDTSRDRAPYDDASYEIWGLNRGYIFMPRADRWFDLHSPTIRGWSHRRTDKHMAWLKQFPGPIYLHETDDELPNSLAFPIDEVQRDLGSRFVRLAADGSRTDSCDKPYFDSSMAYQIGLAIHEGFKEILMVGVDLNTVGEYVWQRSGVSAMLGIAAGRGITVVLPDNCPLLQGNLYGRAYLTPGGEHMSAAQLETRLAALNDEYRQKMFEHAEWKGAVREATHLGEQMIPGLDHERHSKRVKELQNMEQRSLMDVKHTEGGLKETLYWIHQTPDGDPPSELANDLQVEINGHRFDQALSEGHLDAHAEMGEPEPVLVN